MQPIFIEPEERQNVTSSRGEVRVLIAHEYPVKEIAFELFDCEVPSCNKNLLCNMDVTIRGGLVSAANQQDFFSNNMAALG